MREPEGKPGEVIDLAAGGAVDPVLIFRSWRAALEHLRAAGEWRNSEYVFLGLPSESDARSLPAWLDLQWPR